MKDLFFPFQLDCHCGKSEHIAYMEEQHQTINLFQAKSDFSPLFSNVQRYTKIFGIACVLIILASGVGIAFFSNVISGRQESLKKEQETLEKEIENQTEKERMIEDIRARLHAISVINKLKESPVPFIDTLLIISPDAKNISSFLINDKSSVTISIKVTSMDEAMEMTEHLMMLAEQKKIRNPELNSMTMDVDGNIQMNVTYQVIR